MARNEKIGHFDPHNDFSVGQGETDVPGVRAVASKLNLTNSERFYTEVTQGTARRVIEELLDAGKDVAVGSINPGEVLVYMGEKTGEFFKNNKGKIVLGTVGIAACFMIVGGIHRIVRQKDTQEPNIVEPE